MGPCGDRLRAVVPPATAADTDTDTATALRVCGEAALGARDFTDNDHLFDLGDHSITAIRLLNRVREEFRTEHPMTGCFAIPTVRAMTARLWGTARVQGEL